MPRLSLNTKRHNRLILLSCLVVAGVAGTLMVAIYAAGSFISVEPENGTAAGGAVTVTDATASGGKAISFAPPPTVPNGPAGSWTLKFQDEFSGTSVDTRKWTDSSSAEADGGHGNLGNQQLEWNQMANCTVQAGNLVLAAKRQSYLSPSGTNYAWTSCLLTSTPAYTFQYGYIEERAILPAAKGFWPAFWTWQAPGVNQWIETDAYEYYSDNRTKLYLSQHSGAGGGCSYTPAFDPSAGYHTYGVDIEPTGTTWYIDGQQVCQVASTSAGATNIITNLAVYSQIPPDGALTTATKSVDYIRAWQH